MSQIQFGEIDDNEIQDPEVVSDPNIDDDNPEVEESLSKTAKYAGIAVIGVAGLCLTTAMIGSSFATIAWLSVATGIGTFTLTSILGLLGLIFAAIAIKIFFDTFNPIEAVDTLKQRAIQQGAML